MGCYNPGDAALTVHFSDGTTMMLAAEELKAVNNNLTWLSVTGTIVNPNPIPDPVPDPTPNPTPDPVPQPDPIPTPVPVPDPIPAPQPGDINCTVGNDFLSATLGNDVVNGLAGDDQLHGLEGNDVLNAGDGDDHVYGNAGNDVLNGGAGKDFLVGGEGNDIFKYNSVSDSTNASRDFIETFEQGKDKINLSALNVGFQQLVFSSVDGYTYIGINGTDFSIRIGNSVQFAASDFMLNSTSSQPAPIPTPVPDPAPQPQPSDINGAAGNDFLSGTINNDVINGFAGNDQLHGIEGNDILRGNAGDDTLYGNAGNDVLIGGAGKDFLVGGDGKDIYQFENLTDSVNGQRDVVEGFRHGEDKIDLTLLHVAANDVQISVANGITTVSIANSNFAVDFIASDQITHDDITI